MKDHMLRKDVEGRPGCDLMSLFRLLYYVETPPPLIECPRNTGIPGRRPGRRIPGRLVGIVSSLEAKFSEKLFENRPGSTT